MSAAMTSATTQDLTAVSNHSTLRLTTFGRKTGKRHIVTTWFLGPEGAFAVTIDAATSLNAS
jgi:hypothetical protein